MTRVNQQLMHIMASALSNTVTLPIWCDPGKPSLQRSTHTLILLTKSLLKINYQRKLECHSAYSNLLNPEFYLG